ncbi:MAG TPA: hypothetical protein VHD62_05540 [Opitutaceae bacterium]|nr:hypothetical protein [Opitutaceae bacterium]
MKNAVLWLLFAIALVAAAVFYWQRKSARPAAPNATPENFSRRAPAGLSPPAKNLAAPAAPKPVVPIEDGKTIDFSTGVPIVKDAPAEKAAIERSLKEMEAASAGVTFGPRPAGGETKKAEPEAPPKR